MKKIGLFLVGLLFVGSSFAVHVNNNSRNSPEYKNMGFKANLVNNSVEMSRNGFSLPNGHSFVYRKLMRTQKTDNPVYPENEYLTYNSNLGFTNYSDNSPLNGTSWYRICAITQASNGKHRYCSNEVVKITYSKNEYKEPEVNNTNNNKPVDNNKPQTSLSKNLELAIKGLAENFFKKLDSTYGNDYEQKIDVLNSVIKQLELIKNKIPNMKSMISYLIDIFEEQTYILRLAEVLDL